MARYTFSGTVETLQTNQAALLSYLAEEIKIEFEETVTWGRSAETGQISDSLRAANGTYEELEGQLNFGQNTDAAVSGAAASKEARWLGCSGTTFGLLEDGDNFQLFTLSGRKLAFTKRVAAGTAVFKFAKLAGPGTVREAERLRTAGWIEFDGSSNSSAFVEVKASIRFAEEPPALISSAHPELQGLLRDHLGGFAFDADSGLADFELSVHTAAATPHGGLFATENWYKSGYPRKSVARRGSGHVLVLKLLSFYEPGTSHPQAVALCQPLQTLQSVPVSEAWVKDDGFEAFQANGNREVYALEELTPTRGYSTSVPEGSGILAFIAPWIGYHASNRLKEVNSSQSCAI